MNQQERTACKAGDNVAIYHSQHMRSQGLYLVIGKTTTALTLERPSDKYRRRFSILTGKELGSGAGGKDTYLIDVASHNRREAAKAYTTAKHHAWETVRLAAGRNNIDLLDEAVSVLKALLADPV